MSSLRARARLALREAETVFAQEVGAAFTQLGRDLAERVRSKMREDTGAEKRNVRSRVTGSGFRKALVVYGDKAQTHVDEYGRRAGAKMPPWRRGSVLFKWVGRKGIGAGEIAAAREQGQRRSLRRRPGISQAGFDRAGARGANKVQERISFLIARKIARRGIPAGKPFERTKQESAQLIRAAADGAISKGVERLNRKA